ncbi:organic cation transporter protein [Dermacentor silvarum]|uniref:organic cation transporter protein n=1 Tax=Dermacentor silvarum TaxID=543639 RepID=UPI001896CAF4|nr:organic cation transporter protein [Dermacentor silvarum]
MTMKSKDCRSRSEYGATQPTTNTMSGCIVAEADNDQIEQEATAYGHGNFQRRIFCYGIVALVVLQCHNQVFAFICPSVDHWCKPAKRFANMSTPLWKNIAIPVDDDGHYSECLVYVYPGNVNDTTVKHCDSWDYAAGETDRSARTFWNLMCHRTWLLSLAEVVYRSGAIFIPVAGYVADMSGRQPVITAAVLSLVFSTIAGCFTESFVIYLVTRFINSACASTVQMLTVIVLFEVIPLDFRTYYIGFACSLGNLVAELFLLFLKSLYNSIGWFFAQIIALAPTLLLLSAPLVIYESPIWLMSMGRIRKAEAIMLKAARINGVRRENAENALKAIKNDTSRSDASLSPAVTPLAIVTPGVIRVRAISVFFSSFAIMFAFFIITRSSRLQGELNAAHIASVLILAPSYLAMYCALNSFGRLKLLTVLLALLGGMSTICGIAIYARPVEVSYVLVIVARAAVSVLIPTNFLYIIELFPTVLRSAVVCGAYSCGRVGAVLAASLTPVKFAGREDVCFALAAMATFANLVVVMQLPETSVGIKATEEVKKQKDLLNVLQRSLSPLRPKRRRMRGKAGSSRNEP